MRVLAIISFVFVGILNAMTITASNAANLALDAYMEPSEFKEKYKNSHNKVGSSKYNNVHFFAIEDAENVVIIFRGTISKANVKTDLNIVHVPFLNIDNTKVHAGFYNVAKHSRTIFRNLLKKEKPIVVIGHSLGGGVALLLGGILEKSGYNATVYTFGAPPVGNKEFVDSLPNLIHYRYAHQYDIIPIINKTSVDKFKKFFTKKRKYNLSKMAKHPVALGIKATLKKLIDIPYDFEHQGSLIYLRNEPKQVEHKNAFISMMLTKASAHRMINYVHGL